MSKLGPISGNRSLGIATTAGQMIKVTEYMRSMEDIEIVMVKDRLNNRTSGVFLAWT